MSSVIQDRPTVRHASSGSILRWMGSKKRTADVIVYQFPDLGSDATYFEPFLGGGSVFFAMRPARSVLGDSNATLMNSWKWIREDADSLWRGVADLDTSADAYYEVRARREDPRSLASAVQFVYLNRNCFNGIYRTNRRDEFNVPFGRNTGALPPKSAFMACADSLNSAFLVSGDFEETLDGATAGDLVYLDPPWQATRATYGEYGYTSHQDVTPERVLQVGLRLRARGVATYISVPKSVAPTFAGLQMRDLEVNYSVASRHSFRLKQTELLVAMEPSTLADVPA